MKKVYIALCIILIISLILISGCIPPTQTDKTGLPEPEEKESVILSKDDEIITNFEDLRLSDKAGQTITVKGKTIVYTVGTMIHAQAGLVTLTGLEDSNGFEILFCPRSGPQGIRNINHEEIYTIKGIVQKGNEIPLDNDIYYIQEIKP